MEPPARLVWNSWEAFACIQDVEVSNSNRCYVHSKKNICAVCHACQIALLILWKESEDATDFLGVLFWQLQVRQVRRVEKARLDKMTSSPKPWVSSRKYHSQANGTIVTPNTLNRLKNYSGPLEWTQKLDCGRPQSNKQKKHTKNASTNKMPRNIWKDTYQSNPWYLCKRHPKMPPTEKKKKTCVITCNIKRTFTTQPTLWDSNGNGACFLAIHDTVSHYLLLWSWSIGHWLVLASRSSLFSCSSEWYSVCS